MSIMILKNAGHEGPGTIGPYLKAQGIPHRIYEPDETAGLRDIAPGTTAVIVLGGPMGVYEMDSHPQLQAAAKVMESAITRKVKVLGICLGAQLMAHVLGARVYKGQHKEIGWMDIELTPEGAADEVMATQASEGRARVEVFQWHGDTFDLPSGAVRLARSDCYDNQAFRYGEEAYALQFHIEADNALIEGWAKADTGGELKYNGPRTDPGYTEYLRRAGSFYDRFFGVSGRQSG